MGQTTSGKIKDWISWGQLGVIIALIVGITTVTFKLNASLGEKADKTELARVECQSIDRDHRISADLRYAIQQFEKKQDKTLELLIKLQK